MATNNNPDLLYVRSRESLLQYEDARLNALLTAVCDFYVTRNDQSIWGNFLRGLAVELSRLDYSYSYDIVNKDPNLLTPPDIRRRWASNLYISSNWPSTQQFDVQYKQMLVQLLAAYKMGTTVEAIQNVIFAYTGINITVVELYKLIGNGVYDQSDINTLSVSVNVGGAGTNPLTTVTSLAQLQNIVQSLYGAIALAKPAHVGLEFQTVFGEGETLDCMLSAQNLTQAQWNDLSAADQQYYQFTGYTQISPALFWKTSTAFVLGNVLRDYNGNFQLLTGTTFPGLSGPGPSQPNWSITSLISTTDNNLTWENISPSVVSTSVASDIVTVTLSYAVGLSTGTVVTLINLGTSTFLNGVQLTVTSVSNNGTSFTANFTHANYSTTSETTGTATFAFPSSINFIQYKQLNATWKALYQQAYTNYCCCPDCDPAVACSGTPQGIVDILRIFIQQEEAEPYGPMLVLAPIQNPAFSGSANSWTGGNPAIPPFTSSDTFGYQNPNPRTTVAAYGRLLSPSLTPTQWSELPSIFVNILNGMSNGTDAIYSYVPTTQFLHDGMILTITGFSNSALNVTAQIKAVTNLAATINATSVASDVVTVYAPNSFTSGMLVTFSGLTNAAFLNGQSLVVVSASPTSFTVPFTTANYTKTSDSGSAEVSTFQIANTNTIALEVPSTITDAGLVTPTLQSGYYLFNGNYILGQPPIITPLQLTSVANASAGNTVYTGIIAGGVSNALVGQSFVVSGFTNAANNGTFTCTASTSTTLTLNNASGSAQTGNAKASGPAVGESWVPGSSIFQGQIVVDSNGNTQIALNSGTSGLTSPVWSTVLNATTNDNGVKWRNVGKNVFNAPKIWVGILNFDTTVSPPPFTGEVGNWDTQGTYGLVAPRLSSVWEISGGDELQTFGLF